MPNSFTTGHIVTAAEYDADVSRLAAWASGKKTSNVATTGTTFAAGTDILASALSFTADGTSDYILRVRAAFWTNATAANACEIHINLDGADAGIIGQSQGVTGIPLVVEGVIPAPSSGAHTVNARIVSPSGTTVTISTGAGGAGVRTPILVAVAVI